MNPEIKLVAASVVKFLKQQLDGDALNSESKESVEVSLQCIETAFELGPEDNKKALDLLAIVKERCGSVSVGSLSTPPDVKAQAEKLKNEGNELLKADKPREALERYTKAIELDSNNAVFFCNRAAVYFKMGDYKAAVADCTAALALQPDYSKAHGRLGLALTAMNKHREARAAYARAVQLEPDNEIYRTNLKVADETLAQQGERPPLDLGGLLQNPALMNMATEMLGNPQMQNLISGLMSNTAAPAAPGAGSGPGLESLLMAGQALAQQMQQANPELIDQLRRQMTQKSNGADENQSQ